MKQKLKDWNARGVVGSFNSRLKTMFVRSEVSELTVFHEMVHMKTWKRLSPEEYTKLPLWEDETIVWDAIWKTKEKWTKIELVDSYEYMNKFREESGISKIIVEEMEELVKLRKSGILK